MLPVPDLSKRGSCEEKLRDALDALLEATQAVATLSAANERQEATIAELSGVIIRQSDTIEQQAAEIIRLTTPQARPATKLDVTIQGGTPVGAAVAISIDDTTGTVNWTWDDDKGDTDAATPLDASGAPVTVTAGSDNPAVATVGASDQTAKSAPISEVAEGDWNVVLSVTDSTGAPAVWPADTPGGIAGTPITASPLAAVVVAGAAGALVASAKA